MPQQNLIYLFLAYTIVWLVLFGYLIFLHGQLGDLKGQITSLHNRHDARRKKTSGGGKAEKNRDSATGH